MAELDSSVAPHIFSSALAEPVGRIPISSDRPEPQRHWAINGDFLALKPNGVARYAREVTSALDRLFAESHPLTRNLKMRIIAPCPSADPPLRALAIDVVPEFRYPRLPQVWVQTQLPRHVRGGLLSFCNLAPIAVRRQIVCIHDLHTRLVPESYSLPFRMVHNVLLPLLGRRVAGVTTVSQFSREQLAAGGIAPVGKIAVTYNGSDHTRNWDDARSELPPPARPFALSLGRNHPHKGLDLLIGLAPLLDKLGLDLWLAGEADEQAIARHTGTRPPNLHLLGRISDDDLKRALLGAACFLFPSRMEGFGLPAVEAMACGCPVVAAPAASLPEVCGAAALYADPDDPPAWIDQVTKLRDDPELRARQVEAGRNRSDLYSWRKIAEQYLRLIAEVDQKTDLLSDG